MIETQASPMLNDSNLGYLYKTLAETTSSAKYLAEKVRLTTPGNSYPNGELGQNLRTAAQLIKSGADTSVYYLSIGGYDTHVGQLGKQAQLHTHYAEALDAFFADLKGTEAYSKVLTMTFSEFGRRVKENGSRGTDHGCAGPLLLVGAGAKPSAIQGAAPNLADLDDGDLKFETDFRSVYATVIKKWLGADAKAILKSDFALLPILG
jgi:uncharacterized protein (DUF1501 family)